MEADKAKVAVKKDAMGGNGLAGEWESGGMTEVSVGSMCASDDIAFKIEARK